MRCTAPLFGSQAWGTPVAWNKHTRTHTHTSARSPSCWVDPGSWLPHWLTRTRAHTHTQPPPQCVWGGRHSNKAAIGVLAEPAPPERAGRPGTPQLHLLEPKGGPSLSVTPTMPAPPHVDGVTSAAWGPRGPDSAKEEQQLGGTQDTLHEWTRPYPAPLPAGVGGRGEGLCPGSLGLLK